MSSLHTRCAAADCGEPTAVGGRCSGCRGVAYCSAKCQKADWTARHKRECSRLRDAKVGAGGEASWGRSGLKEACEAAVDRVVRGKTIVDLEAAGRCGDATALYLLGEIYFRGSQGQAVDLSRGAENWRQAAAADLADSKNVCGINAAMNLGVCYREGLGVQKSAAQAFRFFRVAAEHGHTEAQRELTLCFVNGEGTEADGELALTWARRAAVHGGPRARLTLGTMLLKSSPAEAAGVLERAVAGGERKAEHHLFKLADAGVEEAVEALGRLGM
jgi:TPR repeat protein